MKKPEKSAVKTPATLFLYRQKLPYEVFECTGEIEGTADFMANFLGVPVHEVIKSIVFMDEKNKGYMVLQHGDQTIEERDFNSAVSVLLGVFFYISNHVKEWPGDDSYPAINSDGL